MQHLRRLMVVAGVLAGIAAGIGGYTFSYAKGGSYLTNDPDACVNCHVMREQYAGWTRSSHHAVAACNDCHTPHTFVGKWYVKARNGWHHSVAFTTGRFHEPIRINEFNARVTEHACRDCHGDIVHDIDAVGHVSGDPEDELSCIRCHRNVGHLH